MSLGPARPTLRYRVIMLAILNGDRAGTRPALSRCSESAMSFYQLLELTRYGDSESGEWKDALET